MSRQEVMDFDDACLHGDLDTVKGIIRRQTEMSWTWGLFTACHGGHIAIVRLMIKKGAKNFDWGLYSACRGGHLPIVRLMIRRGAENLDRGLAGACEGCHPVIAAMMLDRGATELVAFNKLAPDQLLQVYGLVTDETKRQLEQQSLPLMSAVILDNRLPEHVILAIVEYL